MKNIERGIRILNSENETRLLGLEIANALEPSDVVALIGDLGTGKTSLTKYIAKGLGINEDIVSPTFNIVHEYRTGRIPLFHFDTYRLSGCEEFVDAGGCEYLDLDGVCVIEWAEIVSDVLPAESLLLKLEYGEDGDSRIVEII